MKFPNPDLYALTILLNYAEQEKYRCETLVEILEERMDSVIPTS